MKFRALLPVLGLVLGACTQSPSVERRAVPSLKLPPMKTFTRAAPRAPSRSNASIAADILDLTFELESGRELPVLTRFEGPITVRVTGPASDHLQADLARLLTRIRREAGIDISRVPRDQPASITIEVLTRPELQRAVPRAACFVVPRVTSWTEFRRARRSPKLDWTTLITREKMAVFLPGDVSPQEVRDCLHEELAQAIGPLNDLYRLADSVFNDDNFHTVLTGFDMLVLKTLYSPQLSSGMTRKEVAARLPAILARLNPRGRRGRAGNSGTTPRDWKIAIETALGPRTSASRRRAAARDAVRIASKNGWTDSRAAFSLYALGRLSIGTEPELAMTAFLQAGSMYRAAPDTDLQAAHVAMQLAAFALSAGQADIALRIVDANTRAVSNAENAALLSTLLMVRAEALAALGRNTEARTTLTESLGWAQYGFGSEAEVRTRLNEISALSPRAATVEQS